MSVGHNQTKCRDNQCSQLFTDVRETLGRTAANRLFDTIWHVDSTAEPPAFDFENTGQAEAEEAGGFDFTSKWLQFVYGTLPIRTTMLRLLKSNEQGITQWNVSVKSGLV
jgi:hypothetical protein